MCLLTTGSDRILWPLCYYSAPETPPSPLSTVPFTRDPDFVHRETLLDQIYSKNSVAGSRIALIGLGGVGKSQLAIEYSYQVRSKSLATWVFWVHASNETRFEQSFRDIADQVKIPGRQDAQVNIFQLVENWLRDEKIGNWVCILDNIDDDQLLCSLPVAGKRDPMSGSTNALTKPLLEYVPRSRNGSIIITSRNREVALKMVPHSDLIEVKPMEQSEAQELLQRKLDQPGESQESRQLVNALESMPLAIVQAASYIRNRAPRSSVSQYLKGFLGSDREATKLLKKEAGHLYRDWEAKNSILVTWQISFDYIRQTKPSAAQLLSLMSFFDRQGIPENLIRHQPKANYTSSSVLPSDSSDEETSESDSGPDFEDDIATLREYSFISVIENSSLFTMHRLVQLTTRAWLKSHGKIDQWKGEFISILCDKFPTGEYENWERCRPLFPHVKSASSQQPASHESSLKWATLLCRGAWYASQIGNIADAREMAFQSRNHRMISLGDEHEETIDSTSMLAMAYWLGGQWKKAEQLLVQVVKTRTKIFGEDDPNTLAAMANLAAAYGTRGLWEDAEKLQVQVMNTSKTKLGADHPETLSSMTNLASTYSNQGRWREAERLGIQAMEARKTKLGQGHPDMLMSMANLAATYGNQGRWEEAEELQMHVVKTSKKKLGEDHPSTLSNMINLASTYRSQGRWEEAEKLGFQVMETRKMKLGDDHPDTISSMANLAFTYLDQGRWEEAEELQVHAMKTNKTKLGDDHPDTLSGMTNLVSIYRSQGRWEEAEKLQLYVMKTSMTKLGQDHPSTLSSMANLVSTYLSQGRFQEAEKLGFQVMEARKSSLGEGHPDTLTSMTNLASTYGKQGRWKEAERLLIQVTETSKIKLGEDHPDTLSSTANLGSLYGNQGQWKEAEKLFVQVIEIRKKKLGEDHPDTLPSMANLASTYFGLGRLEEAERLAHDVMLTRKTKFGVDHPSTLSSMNNLALMYSGQGKLQEVERLGNQVMKARKSSLGESHPDTLASITNLASTYGKQGRWKEAEQLLMETNNALPSKDYHDKLSNIHFKESEKWGGIVPAPV
ncbi:unnamed protein product [Penicillium salamii]|nr:unnamed protein product [Penicillium salamii]CAG8359276.1 unnamed protein product [Penicillium salamii]